MVWVVIVILLLLIGGVAAGTSPTMRLWADKRPGRPGAKDPLGDQIHESAEFQKPPDEGNLL
jgi:hypothetical protein